MCQGYDNTFIRSVLRSKRPGFESLAILKFAATLILLCFTKKKRGLKICYGSYVWLLRQDEENYFPHLSSVDYKNILKVNPV